MSTGHKKIHKVFVADSNSHKCCEILEGEGLDRDIAARLLERVNLAEEAGTFHPLPATCVPLLAPLDSLETHFSDVAKAQNQYVKADLTRIDLEGWPAELRKEARRIVEKNRAEWKWSGDIEFVAD